MNQTQIYSPKIQQVNQNYEMRRQRERQIINPQQLFVCFEQNQKKAIPLSKVKYHLKIHNGLQLVQLEQIYSTQAFNQLLDLEYVFSINENAAVTKMKVELGDQIVYGIVKEKEEAKQEFEEGIKQGKTMAYSEEDEQFPQIKRLKIGQLAPNKQLRVIFEYIQPLDVYLNKFWKIEISPIINENYCRNQSNYQIGFNKIVQYLNGMFQLKDFAFEYTQDIEIEFDTGSPITFWKSPTHQLHSTNAKDIEGVQQENGKKLILKLDGDMINQHYNYYNPENFKALKKFTLLFSSNDINLPRAILSHIVNKCLLKFKNIVPHQLSFPNLIRCHQMMLIRNIWIAQTCHRNKPLIEGIIYSSLIEVDQWMDLEQKRQNNHQFYFLEVCLKTLYLILSHLVLYEDKKIKKSTIIYYNFHKIIINFLVVLQIMLPFGNLQEAIQHVNKMEANMNGTNIYDPLQNMVYNRSYGHSKDTTLNVFLLTDGEDNADPIIELVKNNNRAETRIYTLGIGEGCSFYLIKRVAEVGNGKFHIVGDDEDINEKVIDLLEDSLTPYLEDFKLETNVKEISSIIPNPESIVSLKKNQELTIQILFSNQQELQNIEFSIHCYNPQDKQPIKYSVNLNLNQSQDNEYFHKLAAHKFITYYENAIKYGEQQVNFIKLNKQNLEVNDIVNLSIENQILSNKTAFICEVCELEDQLKQQARSKIKIKMQQNKINYINDFPPPTCSSIQPFGPIACFANAPQQQIRKNCNMFYPMAASSPFQPLPQGIQINCQQQQLQRPQCLQQRAPPPPPPSLPLSPSPPPPPLLSACNMQIAPTMQRRLSPEQPIKQSTTYQCNYDDTFSTSFGKSQQPEINNLTYENLMNFAQADGRFQINNDIQIKVNYLNLSNSQGLIDDVWNTLLILLYLEKFCSQFKKSWQLIFSKGVQYLLQNGIDYKQKKQELNQP